VTQGPQWWPEPKSRHLVDVDVLVSLKGAAESQRWEAVSSQKRLSLARANTVQSALRDTPIHPPLNKVEVGSNYKA
jgi:hypothetical protein